MRDYSLRGGIPGLVPACHLWWWPIHMHLAEAHIWNTAVEADTGCRQGSRISVPVSWGLHQLASRERGGARGGWSGLGRFATRKQADWASKATGSTAGQKERRAPLSHAALPQPFLLDSLNDNIPTRQRRRSSGPGRDYCCDAVHDNTTSFSPLASQGGLGWLFAGLAFRSSGQGFRAQHEDRFAGISGGGQRESRKRKDTKGS
jgi:hypothetical protein